MPGFVHWNPAPLEEQVDQKVAAKMVQMGEIGVAEARRLVPVDTGQTRDSIGYTWRQSDKTLQLYADTRWAVFVEMGTSRQRAQPFLRPAMAKMESVWGSGGVNLEIGLANAAPKYAAGYQAKHGSHVKVKGGILGFGGRKARIKFGKGRHE